MNTARYLVLGALLIITSVAGAQTATPLRPPGGRNPTAETLNVNPQSQPLRMASPAAQPAGQGSTQPKASDRLDLAGSTFQKLAADPKTVDSDLPKAGSPLPLISVIGFGILVGGIVSAMKTRS